MFAVLKINPEEKSLLRRIKYFFSPPSPILERVNVKGAAPFYKLEIYEKQCGEDCCEVAKMLGLCSRAVILADGTDASKTGKLKIYKPAVLPNILTINSAENYLENKEYNKAAFTLGIRDEKGAFSQYLEKFVNLAGEIRVFTKNEFAYKSVCEKIYEKYGLSVIVITNEQGLSRCDMIISPENVFNRYFNNCILEKCGENGYNILKGDGIRLPKYPESLLPHGVDKLTFASALYEACALKSLSELKYDKMNVVFENVFPFGSIDIK